MAEAAARYGLGFPSLNDEGRVRLVDARSPYTELIVHKGDRNKIIPVTFDNEGRNIIASTGFHNRGKTNILDICASGLLHAHMGGGCFFEDGSTLPWIYSMGALLSKTSKGHHEGPMRFKETEETPSDWTLFCEHLDHLLDAGEKEGRNARRAFLFLDEFGGKTEFKDQAAMTLQLIEYAKEHPNVTVVFSTQNRFAFKAADELGLLLPLNVHEDYSVTRGVAESSGGVEQAKRVMVRCPSFAEGAARKRARIRDVDMTQEELRQELGMAN
jgi:hypothetical protein